MIITGPQIAKPPKGYEEIVSAFGLPPEDEEKRKKWEKENIILMPLPMPIRIAGKENIFFQSLQVHRKLQRIYIDTMEFLGHYAWQYVKDCGGSYVYRKMRHGKKLSTHSWGIAIDINVEENPYGQPPKMHPKIVEAFERYGWVWGGKWKYPDGMHFQFCKNY